MNEDEGDDQEDTLVLHLYEVNPNVHARTNRSSAGDNTNRRRTELLVDLHYAIGYRSKAQDVAEEALGGVLQAFHSTPRLRPEDYLTSADLDVYREYLPDSLDVLLETPTSSQLEGLWNRAPSSAGLTLYYGVRCLPIPMDLPVGPPKVTQARPPQPEHLEGAR